MHRAAHQGKWLDDAVKLPIRHAPYKRTALAVMNMAARLKPRQLAKPTASGATLIKPLNGSANTFFNRNLWLPTN